jgi:hypothetical protein
VLRGMQISAPLQPQIRCCGGSLFYHDLERGEITYRTHCFKKD